MVTRHCYIGIEDLGLTAPQRQILINALKQLGPSKAQQPCHLNHWRIRTDGLAAIFEAAFDEDTISISAVRGYLASIFGIDPNLITYTTASTQYGPLITYNRTGDKLRLIQFGGAAPSWNASGAAVRAYLAANSAAWEAAV